MLTNKSASAFILSIYLFLFSCHVSAQIITTVAGTGLSGYSGDGGTATAAQLNFPSGITADRFGNVYIAEQHNYCVRKMSPSGIITTFAGTGSIGFSGDGGPATAAKFYTPWDLAIDHLGNLYIADIYNYRVRKVDVAGIVTTVAGNGINANTGDGGPATNASVTLGSIAVDTFGNLYIGAGAIIRKVNTSGTITTIAGNGLGGFSGDGGPATAAGFDCLLGIDIDVYGNIYIAERPDQRVRKIDTAGIIHTYAGNGTPGYSGDGGPATAAQFGITGVEGVKVDDNGTLYITDRRNNRIRVVNPYGIISTFAGSVLSGGYSGDGGPATAATLAYPGHVARYSRGNIYIADRNNNVVRMISVNPFFINGHLQHATFCSGVAMSLDTLLAANDSNSGVTEHWSLISGPHHGTAVVSYAAITTSSIIYPLGLTYTSTTGYSGPDTFTVRITDGIISDTTTIYATVVAPPVISNVTGFDTVCIHDSISLADTTSGGTWSASNANTTVTAGIVTGVAAGADTIWYVVANVCGLDTVSHVVSVKLCPSSVTTINPKNEITIYPNPATNELTIASTDKITSVAISNPLGQKMYAHEFNSAQVTITIATLPPGMYFVKVNNTYIRKISKE